MLEKNAADRSTNRSIRKAGIIGALVGGLLLSGFAWLGMRTAEAASSLLLTLLPVFLAFIVGAAIGGGLGVWISEVNKKNQQ